MLIQEKRRNGIDMDIVVTIPKSEYKTNEEERSVQKTADKFCPGFVYGFRVFPHKPNVQIGDRIYFVRDGIVSYSKEIFEVVGGNNFDKISLVCDVTNRTWKGKCAVYFKNERDESHLGIQRKGFQGFRYRWWD